MAPRQQAAAAAPLPSQSTDQVTAAIEKALSTCGVHAIAQLPMMEQAIRMANGITALRRALTDEFMTTTIMPLMGTPLGFLADRPNQKNTTPYGITVVRDCLAEALIRGFRPVGNEFNIIASRFYGTKSGFERLVGEYPGLTDLVMQPGVPKNGEGGALVPFFASWRLNGKLQTIDCNYVKNGDVVSDTRIPVKVNDLMGADAIIGKAYRKMYFRIYQRLHGSTMGLVDGDVADVVDTSGTTVSSSPVSSEPSPSKQTGRSQGQGLKDLTQQKRQQQAAKSEPPPANDALTVDQILRELAAATASWAELEADDARGRIAKWSPSDQRAAYAWAVACNEPDDTASGELPRRPDCTLVNPEPGSEG
jgi:hypothetical protein